VATQKCKEGGGGRREKKYGKKCFSLKKLCRIQRTNAFENIEIFVFLKTEYKNYK
jgi:hypothetical protein